MRRICEKMTKWLQSVVCQIWLFRSALGFCALTFYKVTFVQFVCHSLILLNLVEHSILVQPVCIRAILSSRYGCFKVINTLFWLQLLLVKKLSKYCSCLLHLIISTDCWHSSSIVSLFPAVKVLDFDKIGLVFFLCSILKYVLLADWRSTVVISKENY